MTKVERVQGRKIGILGMGRSGLAAAELVKQLDGIPFVSDNGAAQSLTDAIRSLSDRDIKQEVGGHSDTILSSDFVIVSPGISPGIEIIKKIQERGIPIFSELEFASWFLEGSMIAVTGSNGKTTTVSMIDEILKVERRQSIACGNIGKPLSSCVREISRDGVVVVEVSSYQLEFVDQLSPDVAVILNITPDHLERHGSLANYREMKLRLTDAQSDTDTLLLNIASAELDGLAVDTQASRRFFGAESELSSHSVADAERSAFLRGNTLFGTFNGTPIKICLISDLNVPGAHNIENALAAIGAAASFGVSPEAVREGLCEFRGVEHRLEFVGEIDGVRFVNDSKATNLDATARALEATTGPINLILGGRGKGEDFRMLGRLLSNRVTQITALGEAREEIFEALGKTAPVVFADSMKEAVTKLFENSEPGETILLSPGCASFDQYRDFEKRGEDFKQIANRLIEEREERAVEK